ncbi:hypothetical protein AX15_003227 [Amanita polypyramis BW_CC]|nr:hypothetical protein AX15_003227 [Amanita polypyramis BW_CC]
MLSEKAKGKQRAIDSASNPSTSHVSASFQEEFKRDFVIRFTEGTVADLLLAIHKSEAVRDVKKKIRYARPELNNRRLRLIQSGQLLTDSTHLLSHFASLEERRQKVTNDDASGRPSSDTAWLHCSVGPPLEPGEEENDDGRSQTTQIKPQRGFDRLASMGFSDADIANFRRQFHSRSLMNYLDLDFETEEEYDEYARSLEEQWIDSLDNTSTASLSQSPTASSSSVLQGVVVGFFFPILPFFFMRNQPAAIFWEDGSVQDSTPNVILSESMQVGLVVGFLVNILFGLWRFVLNTT